MIISVDGIIGCGKSTQISKLMNSKYFNEFKIYPEEVDKWVDEKWIESFYHDSCRFCFGFQMRVLLSHSKLLKYTNKFSDLLETNDNLVICERNPFSSCMIFGDMAYESKLMTEMEKNLNYQYFEKIGWKPNHIIYLKCSPNIAMNRTMNRNRDGEDRLSISYLKKLNEKYDEKLKNISNCVVHVVDADKDEETVFNNIKNIITDITNNNK